MWQKVQLDGVTTKWYDDRADHWEMFRVNNEPVHVLFRAYFTGGDDDVEYIITKNPRVPPPGKHELSVLAYNIYMRTGPFYNGQRERGKILGKELRRPWDVILFSEVFDDDVRNDLVQALNKDFPHSSGILGSEQGIEEDSGVLILSKWPIEGRKELLFEETCAGSDCMADKGVLYTRINKHGKRYHLFATHLDAGHDADDRAARWSQLIMAKNFVKAQNIPASEPVIVGGDLNIDRYAAPQQYQDMLTILGATSPQYSGLPYSADPRINDLSEEGPSEHLDYLLVLSDHKQPEAYPNEVILIRSAAGWKEFGFEKTMYDLSDHFGVQGVFPFRYYSTGIAQPIPKAVVEMAPKGSETRPAEDLALSPCVAYARASLDQQRANTRRGCGYAGPEWKADYNYHLLWCERGDNRRFIDAALEQRQQQLDSCKGTAAESGSTVSQSPPGAVPQVDPTIQDEGKRRFCESYADAAVAQYELGIQFQLEGITPPVWSRDHNAHLNWCMQMDQPSAKTGDTIRAQHLLQSLPKAVLEDMKTRNLSIPGLDPGLGP
jgi:endonuclease/exonuclease/phosphatase family metal-dependent hydrolase